MSVFWLEGFESLLVYNHNSEHMYVVSLFNLMGNTKVSHITLFCVISLSWCYM